MLDPRILVAGLVACTFAVGCSASPEDVCGHIEQIVKTEVNEQAAEQAVDGCEFKWKMRKDTKGLLQYKELADCVMDADSVEALGQCK